MKKNIFIAAAAALIFTFTACQKEDIDVPVNNPGTTGTPSSNARVKSTSDLHNTDWTYDMTYVEFLDMLGVDTTCWPSFDNDTLVFGLNFDGTYAHFSFPDNIEAYGGDEGMLDRIYGVSYTYSYNGTSHIGYLDGVDDENSPVQLQFTYNDTTDVITFNLPMYYAEDSTAVTLTLNFSRNE